MLVRTPAELGALIRDRRKQLHLDQAALAHRVGVSRQWLIDVERGHARAELGLVLRILAALNIRIDADIGQRVSSGLSVSPADIDAIVASARKKR